MPLSLWAPCVTNTTGKSDQDSAVRWPEFRTSEFTSVQLLKNTVAADIKASKQQQDKEIEQEKLDHVLGDRGASDAGMRSHRGGGACANSVRFR